MVDLSKVSESVQKFVQDLKKEEGNKRKIDTQNEYNKLSSYLAGNKDDLNVHEKEFIQGFMIEYETNKKDEQITENTKDLVKDIKKRMENKKKIDTDEEANALALLLRNTKGELKKADLEFIRQVLIDSGYESYLDEQENPIGVGSELNKENEPSLPKENDNKTNEGKETPNLNPEPKSETKPEPKKQEKPALPINKPEPKPEPKPDKPEVPTKPTPGPIPVPVPMPIPVLVENKVNNSVNQHGKTNVINNGTIIVNNGTVDPLSKNSEADSTKNVNPQLPPRTIKEARDNGKDVAELLTKGITGKNDQIAIKNILTSEVNSYNVIEFLRGYEENRQAITSDFFFEQMRTENSFEEKQNLMHKVAGDLEAYFEIKYGVDSPQAQEVAVILEETEFTSKHAEKLDDLVDKELNL